MRTVDCSAWVQVKVRLDTEARARLGHEVFLFIYLFIFYYFYLLGIQWQQCEQCEHQTATTEYRIRQQEYIQCNRENGV